MENAAEPEYITDDDPIHAEPAESKPWDDAVQQAKASLQVRRIELERSELERAALEATRRREEKSRNEALAGQEQQARAKAAASEAQRLASLRQYGDMLAAMASAPTEYRAAVTRDLTSYVTSAQFPASAWAQSYEYVKARVERTLKPWRDEEAREQRRTERANVEQRNLRECEVLIRFGMAHAERELASFDEEAAEEAREVLEGELREEVRAGWTQRDVVELVDEILDEWE